MNNSKELCDEIASSDYIACICEGKAEKAIIDLLLEHDKLKFKKEKLVEEKPILERNAKKFEERYLKKAYSEKILVLRILDSHSEAKNFNLSKAYKDKVKVINVITAPEIEMLIIINERKYNDYIKVKSSVKPSEYCKNQLKINYVKTYDFVKEYFGNINILLSAIAEYNRLCNKKNKEYRLYDILK